MHNTTFRTRLFFCFLGVILVAVLLPGLYVRQAVRQGGIDEATRSARREALLIRALLEATPRVSGAEAKEELTAVFERLDATLGLRATYIEDSGKVLAESSPTHRAQDALKGLDNHKDRAEFIEALQHGQGTSVRHSETLATDLVYAAVKVTATVGLPAGVIRVAVPLQNVHLRIADAMWQWFGILATATLIALALAYALSARLEGSLREMIRVVQGIAPSRTSENATEDHGRKRLHVLPGKEFRPLAAAVNNMADRIEENLRTIAGQKAQLETILDVMAEGVLVIGAQGRIRLANQALVRIFPLVAQAVDKKPVEVIPVAEIQQAFDELLAAPPNETRDQTRRLSLEVEARPELVLSVHMVRPREPMHDVLAVAVFYDVSEMARLIRVRREFVANVSHELRTPLTTITGYAETLIATLADLLAGPASAQTSGSSPASCKGPNTAFHKDAAFCQSFAETILRHARHMADMVNDLLRLSRIENGTVPMEIQEMRLSTVLSEALSSCRQLLADKEVGVKNSMGDDPKLLADPHFLFQVFRNLLENASRYAPKGSVITVSARPAPGQDEGAGESGHIEISVHDEGPGIPAEDLSRVFERFYRVEKHRGPAQSQSSVKNGALASTGLGLAISKHIIERHHGRIWAEDGPGATIKFTLPLAGPSASKEDA